MRGIKLPLGPGALVAAAFIGPGTVTACTVAGASFGFALVWALVFATVSAIILQEMSARLGVVSGKGLGAVLIQTFPSPAFRYAAIGLVLSALYIGNAAYESGNIAGSALGLATLLEQTGLPFEVYVAVTALIAGILLWRGTYRVLEQCLIGLVLIMALSFLIAVFVVRPDPGPFLAGLRPSIPAGSLTLVLALIGTTVVPYNLFLHAAASRGRWQGEDAVGQARRDTFVSVGLGGLVSILILSTAAATVFGSGLVVENAGDMSRQLEPGFGSAAAGLVAIGLFAAGLSSAITAPLATAYAVSECFDLKGGSKARTFRLVALSVLIVGTVVALSGIRPVAVILFAQLANGLLLPIIAVFLLYAMNQRTILGEKVNSLTANILGGLVVLVTFLIGARLIWLVIARLTGG
ncbi:Nramp family divalent metal transporter [Parvularcula sp. IMCC14364]|uniref:Nramp family divalent metal transporter n=1 Tax=Parvularcula sp. IMCC14364 TaxID=3067902 RepID=UPI00274256CF|nr:Nramp family divalent metal transporter [Parvularcula sp. IMCC14364]